jgi:AraC family transcriptional regulator
MSQTQEGTGALAPRFVDGRAMLIAGLGGRYNNENRGEIPALWVRFGPKYFGRVPGQVDKRAYGICSNMDPNGSLDYLAGVEVAGAEGLPPELAQLRIAPHRYAVFAHDGHISAVGRTWMDIFDAWLPQSGYAMDEAPCFECYLEEFDPTVGVGNVEIWIPIKT